MPPSNGPRLAIIMPSFRFDAAARQALTLLATIASDDIAVHIGDNSENPDKHAFLRDLAARHRSVTITCHARNIGAEANWLFLVRAQTAPLICMAADDDTFSHGYFAVGAALLSEDAGCSAASGLLLSFADEPGRDDPTLFTPQQRLETDPLARLSRYSNQNAIAYAVNRTATIQKFAVYVEDNPLKGAFNDYLLAYHLLSMGTYRLDRAGQAYVYDNNNWHQPNAAYENNAKFYRGCGLPAEFGYLNRLHWAVANDHFFRSRFRAPDLAENVATRIAAYCFHRQMAEFRDDLRSRKSEIDTLLAGRREATRELTQLLERPYATNDDMFAQFARIVSAFVPELGARYLRFLDETLLPHAPARVAYRPPSRAGVLGWLKQRA